MERSNEVESSSSSFTSELFGSKEASPPSAGIFSSIFAPSPKVVGRDSLRSQVAENKQDSSDQTWNPNTASSEAKTNGSEGESQGIKIRDTSFEYQEQRPRVQPCHLSSSIYYGGQDVYAHPQNTQNPGPNFAFKKDGGEDDSGSASRGNWWQGSLYY